MQKRFNKNIFGGALLASVCTALIGASAMAADAPAKPAAKAAYKAPRLIGDTHPDLNGIWQALNTANYDVEPHSARAALQMVPGQFVPVPSPEVVKLGAVGSIPAGLGVVEGNEIPYTAAALAKKKENAANWIKLDPEIKCYLPGVPRATYMPYPFQISQSKQAFFIAYEYAGAVRNVYLKDPGPAPTDSWMGQSVGKWDGDTFVVDVTGMDDRTWFDRAGNFHSDKLHVVERYTPMSPDHLMYEATIDDPKTFTRPWKIGMPLYRRVEKNAQLMQFKCVEFVEELMYGHLRKKPAAPATPPAAPPGK
jgi:hypothetical protein